MLQKIVAFQAFGFTGSKLLSWVLAKKLHKLWQVHQNSGGEKFLEIGVIRTFYKPVFFEQVGGKGLCEIVSKVALLFTFEGEQRRRPSPAQIVAGPGVGNFPSRLGFRNLIGGLFLKVKVIKNGTESLELPAVGDDSPSGLNSGYSSNEVYSKSLWRVTGEHGIEEEATASFITAEGVGVGSGKGVQQGVKECTSSVERRHTFVEEGGDFVAFLVEQRGAFLSIGLTHGTAAEWRTGIYVVV